MKKSLIKQQNNNYEKSSFFKKIVIIWNRQFNLQWFLAKQKADKFILRIK